MTEWLSHVAFKGAIVLLIALFSGLLLHRLAAARRYAVWITAVGALALLPPAMLLLPAWRVLPQANKTVMEWPALPSEAIIESHEPLHLPEGSQTELSKSKAAPELPATAPAPVAAVSSKEFSWQEIAAILPHLWLTISTLLLLRLAWGAGRLRRLEHTLEPGTCELLTKVAQEMQLKRTPRLLIGGENAVPMVWGVWRQRLLLPRGFESWSPEKLRGVLLHELAHLKRRDPLALWTAQWVKAFHWFNPLAWLTLRQLRADQERACDDTVLRHGVRPSDYAQHLLDLSRHTRLAPGLSLCALTITRCAPVEARVKAILDSKRSREGLTSRWLLSLAGLALLTTLPVAMLHAIEGPKLRGRMLDRNGVVLAETTEKKMRHYPLKALTGHVTGYTRLPDDKRPQPWGGAALERTHDAALSEGKNLDLSIDARIQSLVLRALQEAGYTRGAAVILDPRTGEILASVSLPIYDPNIMVPSISEKDWEALLKNTDTPLLDRCNAGRFAPGAAFMPLTALAGMSKRVERAKFNCTGSVTYGSRAFQCWKTPVDGKGHGPLGMTDAIFTSCNCYWYQFGNQAGADAIAKVGHLVGFGENFNITYEGMAGTLPSPEWMAKERPNERWTAGHTANLAIGQGALTATPLHMAVLAATVAQRGKVPQPTFLRIKDTAGAKVRADLAAEGLTVEQMEQLREGMRQVVNKDGGTGKEARSDKVVIAGKTGTAQTWRTVDGKKVEDNTTWFIGFAPFDHPTLAFAILKQGGKSGGHDCAPLAKRIVEDVLALPADGSGEVKPVEETAEALRPFQYERQRAKIAAALGLAEKEIGEGLGITSRSFEGGSVTLEGEAASLNQAVQLRDKLTKLGKEWNLTWQFPIPQPVPGGDGQRVRFRAVGTVQADVKTAVEAFEEKSKRASSQATASLKKSEEWRALRDKIKVLEAEVPPNLAAIDAMKKSEQTAAAQWHALGVPAQKVHAGQMSPADRGKWLVLQKHGALADLPQEAAAHVATTKQAESFVSGEVTYFWFSAPREDVHRWLTASMSEKTKRMHAKTPPWPDAPQPFFRIYAMQSECSITLHCLDGKTVVVKISKYKRPVLITPPGPKTTAPKELDGVVSVGLGTAIGQG